MTPAHLTADPATLARMARMARRGLDTLVPGDLTPTQLADLRELSYALEAVAERGFDRLDLALGPRVPAAPVPVPMSLDDLMRRAA